MEAIITELPEDTVQLLFTSLNLVNTEKLKSVFSFLQNTSSRVASGAILSKIKKYKEEAVKTANEILEKISKIQFKKDRIFHNGVFDILHTGHLNAIRQSLKLGDYLVVGVNSDADVAKVKGPTLMKIDERLALVKNLKWVNEAQPDTPYKPAMAVLEKYGCDYYAHGDEFCLDANGNVLFDDIIREDRLRLFKRTEGTSTTVITGRLLMSLKDKMESLDMKDPNNRSIKEKLEIFEQFMNKPQTMLNSIIVTSQRINDFSNHRIPKDSDHIVYILGDFDILHYAHMEALTKAKKEGDFLYVGVFDDNTARKYRGEKSKCPILPLNERALNMLGYRQVDEVIFGAPMKVTEDMIDLMRIKTVVQFVCKEEGAGKFFKKTPEEIKHLQEMDEYIYEIPKKLGILKQIELSMPMDNDCILEKIWKEKEGFLKKFLQKAELEKQNSKEIARRETKELINN